MPQEGEVSTLGGKIWFLKAYPVRDEKDQIIGVVEVGRDITEQKQAEERLRASLDEKEVLLREIHHRVKNNLQIISSLLMMSSRKTQNQEAQNLLTDACSRVYNMSLIHSQLYRSDRFERIDIARHIQNLLGYLSQIYSGRDKSIRVTADASEVYVTLTQAIPCSLILNELISNSFKHAFEERPHGAIKVSVHKSSNDMVLIKVKDDGTGIPEEVDIDRPKALGFELVRGLVQQIKGKMQVKRKNGTEISIEFKSFL
jgi:two-component sensor histidine kinase